MDGLPGLRCPSCGEMDKLSVRVEDATVYCTDCDNEMSRGKVVDARTECLRQADKWAALLSAIDAMQVKEAT